MTTSGTLTEAQFREWLRDAFEYDDAYRAEIRKRCGDNKYMRGIDPKKHKEVKTLFHKDLIEKLEQLTKRVDKFESRMEELGDAAYFGYSIGFGWFRHDMPVSKGIEKILEYLKLEFECEEAKEVECSLVSTLPKKSKKKLKKKAKKKK